MAFKMMMIPYIVVVVILVASEGREAIIGINWGRKTAQRLVPSQVVDLLLQNEVQHARVYSYDDDILEAFSGSGINLTISIPDPLQKLTSMDEARVWVQTYSTYFARCNIRNIFFGGYLFFNGIGNRSYIQSAMSSLQYMQNALNEAGHGEIKATFLHFIPVLTNVSKPSECDFIDEIKEDMITTLRFLQQNNAPFVYEMLPISEVKWHNFDDSFVFPDNQSPLVIKDSNAIYRNQFDFSYDCIVWALNKHNASDVPIIIGMVGWPTDGFVEANASNAERYFKHLLPYVASTKGTPMRPGVPINVFVHALTDENRLEADFTRHWGIYRSNGEPKFKIDLTGQGRDIYPTTAKGIMRMPDRWCVYNKDRSNPENVTNQLKNACDRSDCTSISPTGSCGMLNFEQRVSYAFNMYFQFHFQDERSCDFEGLAYVTVDDPSTSECVYPVEVVKGQQINFVEEVKRTGFGFHHGPNRVIIVTFMLSAMVTLI